MNLFRWVLGAALVLTVNACATAQPADPVRSWTLHYQADFANEANCTAAGARVVSAAASAASGAGLQTASCTNLTRIAAAPPPQPPQTCTTQPSTTTETIACPAGTAPPWQQTTTVTVGPPPSCTVTTTVTPPSKPADACLPVVNPPGPTLYFSSSTGNNANPGTQASPKANTSGIDINGLAAGTTLFFKRGDTWTNQYVNLKSRTATATSPITFDAYGTGAAPTLRVPGGTGVQFGTYNETTVDGGYVIRNLKLDGLGTAQWGFYIQGATRNVTIENTEITGFEIAIHMQNMGSTGNLDVTLRNNNIHHNREMGILGDANNLVMDSNVIEANNFSGSGFNHGLYLGGHATNGRVVNNLFKNNSAVNGICTGGNLTVHGQWDGLLVENNLIQQQGYTYGCYGISINDGYTSPEFFRNVTIRKNDVRNTQCGACVRAAPGVIIEDNIFEDDSAVSISPPTDAHDDPGLNPVVRNNKICRGSVSIGVAGGTNTGNNPTNPCPPITAGPTPARR